MNLETVLQRIRESMVGFLATAADGKPRVRPMAFVVRDDGRLWSSTYRQSGKIRELEQNDQVEICFLGDDFCQVRVTGRVDLSGGADKKAELLELNPKVGNHFPTADDPKFVHLEIVPELIRFKPSGFNEHEVVLGGEGG